jgi:ribosomal protein S18 acetylase RimI-like enzyme
MISVRRARPADAASIGAVHVAAWRSAYPGILPDDFLSRLSAPRQAAYYDHAIRDDRRTAVHVASVSGIDLGPRGGASRIVGFASSGRARGAQAALADGEIETLYVLDDFRERGLGRRLLRAAALHLAEQGCRSAFVWVLRDNPSRWFYARLGGRPLAEDSIRVAGTAVMQTAYVWNPIDTLAQATSTAP